MAVSKQLMPIYDKPMIFYPISTLMLAGIRDIAIITTPQDQAQFQNVLGDGTQWGLHFTYIVQDSPDGLAQAYLLAEDFLAGAPSAMVLGDNLFFGHGLTDLLRAACTRDENAVFGYQVRDPEPRGELEIADLLALYLSEGALKVHKMGRGYAWLDTGTHASLLDAGNFARTLENRQGLQTGCLEEIAFEQGWITEAQLRARAAMFAKNAYGDYLLRLLD